MIDPWIEGGVERPPPLTKRGAPQIGAAIGFLSAIGMVFTLPENAKPPQPHPKGLACRVCKAKTSSRWRGLNGEWCNLHAKEARAAKEAARKGETGAKLEDLEERVETVEDNEESHYEQTKQLAAELKGARAQLKEQADEIAALRQQLARLAQQQASTATRKEEWYQWVPAAIDELRERLLENVDVQDELRRVDGLRANEIDKLAAAVKDLRKRKRGAVEAQEASGVEGA